MATLVTMAFLCAETSANSVWNDGAGGDLADPSKWTSGVPTADQGDVKMTVNGPLTLIQNLTVRSINFEKAGAIYTLDLGRDHVLSPTYRFFIKTGTTVEGAALGLWRSLGVRLHALVRPRARCGLPPGRGRHPGSF